MYRNVGLIVLVAVLAGGILWYTVNSRLSESQDLTANGEAVTVAQSVVPEEHQENDDGQAVVVTSASDTQVKSGAEVQKVSQEDRQAQVEARLAKATKNVKKMRELLDDGSKRTETLAFARDLLKNGIPAEQLAALEAIQWLGGREAVNSLLPMLGEEDVLADTVDETLRNIIEESLYTDVRVMDKESWLEALKAAGNEDAMNVYLTLLSAFPELDSVPVLIELFKSDSALNKKMAQEYMEFIAHGEAIPSAKEAETWWKKWLADRNITEQDLIDYENAGKEDNSALKGDGQGENDDEKQDTIASEGKHLEQK